MSSVLFPLSTLVIGTLTNASPCVVLPAQVPHNNPGPVLHISAVVPNCELLDQREDVKIVRKKVLLLVLVINGRIDDDVFTIEKLELLANLEPGYEVTLLEICAEVAVFGNIGEQLEGHQDVLFSGHRCKHLASWVAGG